MTSCQPHLPPGTPQTQVAIDTRTVDKSRLFHVCAGRILCSLVSMLLVRATRRVETPLNARIRRWYALHSFGARARLDLPTYGQAAVQRQLNDASDNLWGQTVVWQTLELATDIVSAAAQLLASVVVLFQVLSASGQSDGLVLAGLTLFGETYYLLSQFDAFRRGRGACWSRRRFGYVCDNVMAVWLATTFNKGYLKMRGWQSSVKDLAHRKEFVAGGLAAYAISEFKKAAEMVGDLDGDWMELEDQVLRRSSSWSYILKEPLKQLPQVRVPCFPCAVFVLNCLGLSAC